VRRAAPELTSHSRREDYSACPYQPSLIVARIKALENQDAWNTLCAELGQLPDEELELFEDEIRKPEHARRMSCADDLLARIEAHWVAAAARLNQAHPKVAGETAVPVLPSRAIAVDTSRREVLSDGGLSSRQIAITFDDGPHPTRTPRILRVLAQAGVKANFFQVGRNAATHPTVAKQVMDAGHPVGSHTYSHPNLLSLSEAHAELEIEAGDSAVALALGVRPGQLLFFRFPYGMRSAGELDFVRSRGDTTFFWNMDSLDWRLRDPHKLFQNILAELDRAQRGILLLHDIQEQTVIVLPHLLRELKERGYETVYFVPAVPLLQGWVRECAGIAPGGRSGRPAGPPPGTTRPPDRSNDSTSVASSARSFSAS
jgi:peptidoglycan/xylan/chitin deacetylase (PgdA/CDA1 family)